MTAAGAPSVSVILPTRNRAGLLRRAIASVLGQTYRDLELIVVNDASTDDTSSVLHGISDRRLRIVHREENRGAAAARNAGLAVARGALVSFQDDDDFWLVEKLEKQVAALRSGAAGAGWCIACYVRLERTQVYYVGGQRYIRQLDFRRGVGSGGPDWSLISTPGWLVRRDTLQSVGDFDERMRSWDDWELGLRLSSICQPVIVDEPLWVQDHIAGEGMTKAERAHASDLRIIMEKHGHVWAGSRRVLAQHHYVIGRVESLHYPAPAGREMLWASLRGNPFRPKTWAALALSLFGPAFAGAVTRSVRRLRQAWK